MPRPVDGYSDEAAVFSVLKVDKPSTFTSLVGSGSANAAALGLSTFAFGDFKAGLGDEI